MALATMALVVVGCELGTLPDGSWGRPLATYATGRASLVFPDRSVVLDQVSPGPHLTEGLGTEVYWFNEDGWGLRLTGGGSDPLFPMPPVVTIDRVSTTYWSATDFESRCRVKVARMDDAALRGTASCEGLRWTEMLRGGYRVARGPVRRR